MVLKVKFIIVFFITIELDGYSPIINPVLFYCGDGSQNYFYVTPYNGSYYEQGNGIRLPYVTFELSLGGVKQSIGLYEVLCRK